MRAAILALVLATGLWADWEEVRHVAAGQKIHVNVRQGETARGSFVSASESGVVVREQNGERTISRGEIRKVRVSDPSRRVRNALIGTAIGVGAGIAIGWAVCPHCANEGNGGKFVGPGAAIGAGIGAAAGLLPAPMRTIYKAK